MLEYTNTAECLAGSTHLNNVFGIFAVFLLIPQDLLLFFLLLIFLLHVAVQEADQELRVRLDVVQGQIEDVLAILDDSKRAFFFLIS